MHLLMIKQLMDGFGGKNIKISRPWERNFAGMHMGKHANKLC